MGEGGLICSRSEDFSVMPCVEMHLHQWLMTHLQLTRVSILSSACDTKQGRVKGSIRHGATI